MIFASALVLLGSVATAQAAGCLSGAVVGGIARHMVGHGKVGAAAGCADDLERLNAIVDFEPFRSDLARAVPCRAPTAARMAVRPSIM